MLTLPTREDLHRLFMDEAKIKFPAKNLARGGDLHRLSRVVSALGWSILAKLHYLYLQLFPDTATGEHVARWGNLYGVERKGPAPAQAAASLRVTGTAGAAVPQNAELTTGDGTPFKIASVGAVITAGGSADVDVVAIAKGAIGNRLSGEVLTFSATPPGLNATATLVKDLVGGEDYEEEAFYKERYLETIRDPPEGGAPKDYVYWAKAVPGVYYAYPFPRRRQLGTVDVMVLGKGKVALADTTEVFNHIEARRPGDMKDFQIVQPSFWVTDVTISVAVNETRFRWDFHDDGVGYAIGALNAGAKTITVPTLPAAARKVGTRITVNGLEARISAITGDDLTVDPWFTLTPMVNDKVRASGDLVGPVRAAILAHFDKMGPARQYWPYGDWEDVLYRSKLTAIAGCVDGVRDVALVTPVNEVTPVDTLSATIPMIVAGKIMVHRKI